MAEVHRLRADLIEDDYFCSNRQESTFSVVPSPPDAIMGRHAKLIRKILGGQSDANIGFEAMRSLLKNLGFDERVRGSHYIFRREGVEERLNLQRDDGKCKPYQVRQVRNVIVKYQLGTDDE